MREDQRSGNLKNAEVQESLTQRINLLQLVRANKHVPKSKRYLKIT